MHLHSEDGRTIDAREVLEVSVLEIIKVQLIPTWVIIVSFFVIFIFALIMCFIKKDIYEVLLKLEDGKEVVLKIQKSDFLLLNRVIAYNKRNPTV